MAIFGVRVSAVFDTPFGSSYKSDRNLTVFDPPYMYSDHPADALQGGPKQGDGDTPGGIQPPHRTPTFTKARVDL